MKNQENSKNEEASSDLSDPLSSWDLSEPLSGKDVIQQIQNLDLSEPLSVSWDQPVLESELLEFDPNAEPQSVSLSLESLDLSESEFSPKATLEPVKIKLDPTVAEFVPNNMDPTVAEFVPNYMSTSPPPLVQPKRTKKKRRQWWRTSATPLDLGFRQVLMQAANNWSLNVSPKKQLNGLSLTVPECIPEATMKGTPCRHFLQGRCRKGKNCKFLHQANIRTYSRVKKRRELAKTAFIAGIPNDMPTYEIDSFFSSFDCNLIKLVLAKDGVFPAKAQFANNKQLEKLIRLSPIQLPNGRGTLVIKEQCTTPWYLNPRN